MLKVSVISGFVFMLFLSLHQMNVSNAFGEKVDYNKIYVNECRKCHERDGKGTKRGRRLGVPDFTDPQWQVSVKDEQLIKSITKGKKKMPKQEGRLSTEEIKAMVKYVRFFGPRKR